MKKYEFMDDLRNELINEIKKTKDIRSLFYAIEILKLNKFQKKIQEYLKQDKNFTNRDEANAITAFAFRNGFLEDLHAGEHSKILENDKYSRITQEEMKKLMIESSAMIERILIMKKYRPTEYGVFIRDYGRKFCGEWDRDKKTYKLGD